MSAVVQIADRAGLLANWPLLAGKSLMPLGYSLKGCHRPQADIQPPFTRGLLAIRKRSLRFGKSCI